MSYLSCAIAFAFILATLVCIFNDKNLKNQLTVYLNPNERKIYKEIIDERKKIYFQGFFLGIFLTLLYLFFCVGKNDYQVLCVAIAITFTVNYFYYILYPKKRYMLEILDSRRENKAWLKIYRNMQTRFHLGFLFGLIACGFFYHFMIFFKVKLNDF